MSTQPFTQRPRGVTVLASLQAAGGGLAVAAGAAGAALAGSMGFVPAQLQAYVPAIGGAMVAAGVLSLVLGAGLWRGLVWAWVVALAVECLHALADVSLFATQGFRADKLIDLAVAAIVALYLLRPGVRAYFTGRAI